MESTQYVILTSQDEYIVEYLLQTLVTSTSIAEAKTFNSIDAALQFKKLLVSECNLTCSVNTFISDS